MSDVGFQYLNKDSLASDSFQDQNLGKEKERVVGTTSRDETAPEADALTDIPGQNIQEGRKQMSTYQSKESVKLPWFRTERARWMDLKQGFRFTRELLRK